MFFKKPFTFDDIPDLTGKVAVITGANTGIGFVTAREIARKGARVIVCSRNVEKGQGAVEKIKSETGNQNVEFVQLDLQSLKKVKKAADEILAKDIAIDILVNNAGIMATPFELSADGIEAQFATNHLGHFLFTMTLLPKIEAAAPSRIVNVSSFGHNITSPSGIDFENLTNNKYNIWSHYGQSKLANILFANELDRRLKDKQIYVNSLHPGVVQTDLTQGVAKAWGKIVVPFVTVQNALFGKSPDDGALNQLYLATSPEVEEKGIRGKYITPYAKVSSTSKWGSDEELAKKLWVWSEETVNEKLNAKIVELNETSLGFKD